MWCGTPVDGTLAAGPVPIDAVEPGVKPVAVWRGRAPPSVPAATAVPRAQATDEVRQAERRQRHIFGPRRRPEHRQSLTAREASVAAAFFANRVSCGYHSPTSDAQQSCVVRLFERTP